MAVTLTTLLTEFYARGYDYLNDGGAGAARATRWANQANRKLITEEQWPFRLTTATGSSPLTIATLGKVKTVVDATNSNTALVEMTEEELADSDLTTTGIPLFWWRDGTAIKVWPVATVSLTVRYFALPATMASGSDTSPVPDEYLDVIVDDMVRHAAKDSESQQGVALAAQEYEAGLAAMRNDLLNAPRHVRRVSFHEDG